MLSFKWKFSSMWVRVELKGARITLLVETFLTMEFWVEFRDICSAKGSVFYTSPAGLSGMSPFML